MSNRRRSQIDVNRLPAGYCRMDDSWYLSNDGNLMADQILAIK